RRADDFLVGPAVAVRVEHQGKLVDVWQEEPLPAGIARRCERCADGGTEGAVGPEGRDAVLEAIAVRVAQEPDGAVITDGVKLAIRAVPEIVQVVEFYGQLLHLETRYEHLHRRCVRDGDERNAARAIADAGMFGREILFHRGAFG